MTRQTTLLDQLRKQLDPHSNVPVYVQLAETIRQAIEGGQLRPGDGLPTVRALASALNLAPNTVARTFTALKRDGLTENRAGAGTTVATSAWLGRLKARDGLRELETLVGHLLHAGIKPEQVRETLDRALNAHPER